MDNRMFLVIDEDYGVPGIREVRYLDLELYDQRAAKSLRVGQSTVDCGSDRIVRLEDKNE